MKRRFRIRKVIGILCMAIIGVLFIGGIVMLLWNALMPDIFHLREINFWQALGLFILAKLFFSGFRGGPRFKNKRDNLREAWTKMTPEQQEKFRQEWGRRCRKPFWGEPFSREDAAANNPNAGGTPNTADSTRPASHNPAEEK